MASGFGRGFDSLQLHKMTFARFRTPSNPFKQRGLLFHHFNNFRLFSIFVSPMLHQYIFIRTKVKHLTKETWIGINATQIAVRHNSTKPPNNQHVSKIKIELNPPESPFHQLLFIS